MLRTSNKSKGFLIFTIVLGLILGSILGEIIGNSVTSLSFMKYSYAIGTQTPLVLNLKAITLTLGLNFNVNLMSIIGVIVAIIIYRRF